MEKHLTPLKNDCSKYYKCLGDNLLINSCPFGYLWDDSIKKCNVDSLVSNVTCTSLYLQSSSSSPSSLLEGQTITVKNILNDAISCAARHLSKIDCYNYYFCLIEGNKKVKLEIRTCNDGKVFDEETADCQDKIYVKVPCGTSAI
jgi:hypothetical protein